jgi:hypothetical protein
MPKPATNAKPADSTSDFEQKESKEMLRKAESEISQLHPKAPGLGMGSVKVGPRRPDEDDEGGEGGGGVALIPHPALENTPEGADPNISSRADQNSDAERQLEERSEKSEELQMQLANEKKLTNTKTSKPRAAPTPSR